MTFSKLNLLLCLPLVIAGCGGSSSEKTSSEVELVKAPQIVNKVEENSGGQLEVAELNALEVDRAFDFNNHSTIELTVTRPAQGGHYYLQICTRWQNNAEKILERSSCVWSGAMSQTNLSLSLTLPAHQTQLIAELWHLELGQASARYLQTPVQVQAHFAF